jgi:hypothetical protein
MLTSLLREPQIPLAFPRSTRPTQKAQHHHVVHVVWSKYGHRHCGSTSQKGERHHGDEDHSHNPNGSTKMSIKLVHKHRVETELAPV